MKIIIATRKNTKNQKKQRNTNTSNQKKQKKYFFYYNTILLQQQQELFMVPQKRKHQDLGLQSLERRRLFSKPCFFFKTFENKSLDYLFRIIPQRRSSYITGIQKKFLFLKLNITFTKNCFTRVLLLNGIISIKTLEIVKVIPCSTLIS